VKVLVAGNWWSELHEAAVESALQALGHEVHRFAWDSYFWKQGLIARAENKYLLGPRFARLNRDLIARTRELAPDLVFVYRGTHVTAATLDAMRAAAPRAIIVGYNNDDPFGPGQPRWLWRHFLRALPHYDAVLAYRHVNLGEYRAAGARRVHLLRSWFMPERSHPVELSAADHERYDCDVVFVGHYEEDGRLEALDRVVEAGFRLRLFGPDWGWHGPIAKSRSLGHLKPVRLVWGEEYNKALCGAKVALCFLSRLNRDTYTRRCFEIPATGTLMLSEYTDDLASLYTPGVEADYFRDPDELVAKLELYVGDDARRRAVAAAGQKRVWADGHDAVSRMRELLDWIARECGGTAGAAR
jgi:spore maturation protein CgeB